MPTKISNATYQKDRRDRIKRGEPSSTRGTTTSQWLTTMAVGERRYVETTLDDYAVLERRVNMPHSRRPEVLKDWVFSTQLFTAVSTKKAGDIRYLVCIERKA